MPWIISLLSLKGGSGKSTLSVGLASTLAAAGHRVLLLDADTAQGTASDWDRLATEQGLEGGPSVFAASANLRRDLERLESSYDVVVIDGPPRLDTATRRAALVSDLVLVPATPGAADVWALRRTLELLAEVQEERPALKVRVVLNRADPRTTITAIASEALASSGAKVLPMAVNARVAHPEAMAAGQGVVTYAKTSAAANEMRAFTEAAIAELVQTKGRKGKKRVRKQA